MYIFAKAMAGDWTEYDSLLFLERTGGCAATHMSDVNLYVKLDSGKEFHDSYG